MISRRDVEAEHERLRELVAGLDDDRRAAFHRAARERLGDPDTYAVLNWFFIVGLHHLYLGRWARGLADIALVLLGLGLMIVGQPVGVVAIVAVAVLELYALFRSQVIVQDWNNRVRRRILREQGVDPGSAAGDDRRAPG